MSTDRHVPRPPVQRPARLALRIVDAGASGVIDATDLRAEPLVPLLAASLARSRPAASAQPRRRPDPWPMAMLCTALAVVVAFAGVVAAARLAPRMANERARVMDGHLSMHAVSTSPVGSEGQAAHDPRRLAQPRR